MAQHAGVMMLAWMPVLGPLRLALLAALSLSYLLVCLRPWLHHRRQQRAREQQTQQISAAPAWIIAYASQTGNAEQLAVDAAAHLGRAGIGVRLCELASLTPEDVRGATRMLFLVGTYGEGDAPDNAALFVDRVMTTRLPLPHLYYALLALGDSSYRHYCGFGRTLDRWLGEQGAQALFERIDVDRSAPTALGEWRTRLSQLSGAAPAAGALDPALAQWRLIERRLLNAGSAGAPLYQIALEEIGPASPDRPSPQWQSGDLAQIAAPLDPAHPRDYSIASIPADGRIELLVRLHRDPDGCPGLASGWLALQTNIGDAIALRVRQHRRFRLEGNGDRALILIGNGSGIAGLRAHLKAREQSGHGRNWLVFGERNAAFDSHCRSDIVRWQENGVLERLDLVFSRDQAARVHVQHRLLEQADGVRDWVAQGAAVYVCGALVGMAGGVDDALASILGRPALDALAADGRYRRDVY
jgi:sulfite reductase (NADPH) flavoprotein alpha-component